MNPIFRSAFDFRRAATYDTPAPAAKPKEPIRIEVILHIDINRTVSDEKRLEKNLDTAKKELEKITGRTVEITRNYDSQTRNFQYNYSGNVAIDLEKKTLQWERAQGKPVTKSSDYLQKYLFVTPNGISGAIGSGAKDMKIGTASLNDSRGVVHAIGLMFGAKHEDGAVTYDGWWHDTIMNVDGGSPFRGNVFEFSDKNRENIRNHLRKFS